MPDATAGPGPRTVELSLADRLVKLAGDLARADVPFAFGGAIALAYALEEPRATRDLDVNVFVPSRDVERVFAALPDGMSRSATDRAAVERDDQVRLWWDETPVDLFFSAAPFHDEVAERIRVVPFADTRIPVLAPSDLAVFKVLFDRTKDWLDLTLMWEAGTLEVDVVAARLSDLVGDDIRIGRLRSLDHG